ncbi:pentatricopeptide repeat-containing protein At2g20710, mitochondrial-like [Abrus precatorius]|uniref:Pentatricopeptide repeat-containing protein At2g20710, mitochondrial-like n=1 Tax=Abrus precatorius TaxID=3816 RepID=A0A8B8KYF3_ABRPR|nr:pentatricopeptide repeat-containing protein At2g20710, mitochondrial-like [Abrus precatorius]
MMKLTGSRWNLCGVNGNASRLFHSSSTPIDSLFLRISKAEDPTMPMAPILDQWVEEGRDIKHSQLQFFVNQLRRYRRFNHALQVSEWFSDERNLHLLSGDIAIRLDLIAKVHGLDQAEKYFSSISDTSRDFKVYGALLNCYAQHNFVEKAEAIMLKIKEYACRHAVDIVLSYNVLLKLYARIGEYEKLDALMQEMKEKNIYNSFTLTTQLNAYVTNNNVDEMEKLLTQMEADPLARVDWFTFSSAAHCYIKSGQFEKSLAMLKKSEQLIKKKKKRAAYESLLTMYAAIGKKDDVYRIWSMCKNLNSSRNSSYISMLTALAKLDDIDGAERILEEWEFENTCFDFRISNVMMSAYCKNGLLENAEAYVQRLLKGRKKLDGSIWGSLAHGYYKCNEMDKAVETMKKAVMAGSQRGWKPCPFTFAACIDHFKDKGDLELAFEILRICRETSHFSAATFDRLFSYLHGEIPETNAFNLIKGEYNLKTDEVQDEEGSRFTVVEK